METNNVERFSTVKTTQKVMKIIMKHCPDGKNPELEKDLFELTSFIENEQRKVDDIKSLAYELANKL